MESLSGSRDLLAHRSGRSEVSSGFSENIELTMLRGVDNEVVVTFDGTGNIVLVTDRAPKPDKPVGELKTCTTSKIARLNWNVTEHLNLVVLVSRVSFLVLIPDQ